MNGDVKNATCRNHGTHAEAIEITFDPYQTSFRDLLEFFFQIHDPTTLNRQGNDQGASYRSAIFYTSEEQRRVAQDTITDVHTEVPQERSGLGYRSRLAHGVFEVLRRDGKRVIARCPFMSSCAARHPEYGALLDG
jgi:predicted GNAT family acetyltransferase